MFKYLKKFKEMLKNKRDFIFKYLRNFKKILNKVFILDLS